MPKTKNILLLSSSNCHGYAPLEFARREIEQFFNSNNVSELIFIPYAQSDYDKYTTKMSNILSGFGLKVTGIHTCDSAQLGVMKAKAIFVGGGNTFLLLKTLYKHGLVSCIRDRVLNGGLLYMGASAGTNVATKSIHTTNDMPIINPPSFEALCLVPFNINPHYIDGKETPFHMGETRDERILEYLDMPHAGPVLGMREGSVLQIENDIATLKGVGGAVLFKKNKEKCNISTGADLSFLLKDTK